MEPMLPVPTIPTFPIVFSDMMTAKVNKKMIVGYWLCWRMRIGYMIDRGNYLTEIKSLIHQ
jgi:hypothetical protein